MKKSEILSKIEEQNEDSKSSSSKIDSVSKDIESHISKKLGRGGPGPKNLIVTDLLKTINIPPMRTSPRHK